MGQFDAALVTCVCAKDRQGPTRAGSDLFGTTLEIAGTGSSAAGRLRSPTWLMAALLYLKHAINLSNEKLVARWSENLMWQCFSDAKYYTPK